MKIATKPARKRLTSRQRMLREYFSNAVLIAAITQSFGEKKSTIV